MESGGGEMLKVHQGRFISCSGQRNLKVKEIHFDLECQAWGVKLQ